MIWVMGSASLCCLCKEPEPDCPGQLFVLLMTHKLGHWVSPSELAPSNLWAPCLRYMWELKKVEISARNPLSSSHGGGGEREIWGKFRCSCPLPRVDSQFAHCWWNLHFSFCNKWVRFPCLLTSFFYLLVLTSAVPVFSPGKGLNESLWVVQVQPTLPLPSFSATEIRWGTPGSRGKG